MLQRGGDGECDSHVNVVAGVPPGAGSVGRGDALCRHRGGFVGPRNAAGTCCAPYIHALCLLCTWTSILHVKSMSLVALSCDDRRLRSKRRFPLRSVTAGKLLACLRGMDS